MTKHNDYFAAQVLDRVFKTADGDRIGTVPGVAHDEEIAEALIEEQLGREAAVGASQDGDFRSLRLGQRLALSDVIVLRALAADETLVARFEVSPYLVRIYR